MLVFHDSFWLLRNQYFQLIWEGQNLTDDKSGTTNLSIVFTEVFQAKFNHSQIHSQQVLSFELTFNLYLKVMFHSI